MGPQDIALLVTSGISIYAIVSMFFRVDDKLEKYQGMAIDVLADLQELGLDKLAGFARAVAIRDISSGFAELKSLAGELRKDGGAKRLLDESFRKQLPNRLGDSGDLAFVRKALTDHDALNPPAAPVKVE